MSRKWISFDTFCRENNIGKWEYSFAEAKHIFEIKIKEFHKLNELGLIIDGMKGGLVLGYSHQKGGVHMIRQKTEITFEYVGEMEGWEYLSHFKTASKYGKELVEINEKRKPISKYIRTTFKIPETCKIIDTTEKEIAFILVAKEPQFIVNRFATKKYIKEIIELEKNIL